MKNITVNANKESLEMVKEFINSQLSGYNCTEDAKFKIDLAVEEIFVNIVNYAYDSEYGNVRVCCEFLLERKCIIIKFIDSGKEYNPLLREDPNINLPVNDREIGGLGIFLVKKYMDGVEYEYKDGENILTIKKFLME